MKSADFRTTVDVELTRLDRIENYAKEHNMSSSEVINIVLDKYIQKLANKPKQCNRLMKYQKRGTKYKPTHIWLSSISYSRLRDIMLLFRYSLSYMLSLAMEFFDDFMENTNEFLSPPFHATIVSFFDGFSYFSNYWGLPPIDHIPETNRQGTG